MNYTSEAPTPIRDTLPSLVETLSHTREIQTETMEVLKYIRESLTGFSGKAVDDCPTNTCMQEHATNVMEQAKMILDLVQTIRDGMFGGKV